jgi:hypothetical protein
MTELMDMMTELLEGMLTLLKEMKGEDTFAGQGTTINTGSNDDVVTIG